MATNDIHYLTREDAKTQDILLCIGTGSTIDQVGRMKFSCDEFYMKSAQEMDESIGRDYPEAISNTLAIAEKCNVEIETDRIILPVFEVPELHTTESYLRERCIEGLKVRYGDPVPQEAMDRLDTELAVVGPKGIAAYFLIVEDFTRWAKAQGIGVGPGRGSAAGSIIAYSLGITNLDPISNGLLFERFLNPERTEMPDIDMDFDDERRGEVIDYVQAEVRRGQGRPDHHVQQDEGARGGARRRTRHGLPLRRPGQDQQDDRRRARRHHRVVAQGEHRVQGRLRRQPRHQAHRRRGERHREHDAWRGRARGRRRHLPRPAALPRAGQVRHQGRRRHHPVRRAHRRLMGLLKMDFLGLRTLTVIAKAVENVERLHGIHLVPDDFPLDDPETFALLQRADTVGVFQVESAGMRQLLKRMKPETFGDIVAILALYRPGPLKSGMVDDFVDRKRGRKAVTYYDDRLKPILEETYGAIVYQEQVMRISMEMSGFSAAKADKLRKAMGKKKLKDLEPLKQPGSRAPSSAATTPSCPTACGTTSRSSPSTRSTRATRRRTASSPCRPRTSRPTTRSSTWPPCSPATAARPRRSSTTSPSATARATPCCRRT